MRNSDNNWRSSDIFCMNNFYLTRKDTSVMKGIAICAMLCHHLYTCPEYIGEGIVPYTGIQAWIGILCKVCVALFLFCSGYGLAANYKAYSIKDDIKYIAKRLVKFYTNYWVIFLIFVPITYFVFGRTLADAYGQVNIPKRFVYDILAIQVPAYNITWWFNKLIIILYLLFPILYRVINIRPWVAILLSMVVVHLSDSIHIPYDNVGICLWQLPFILGISWKLYQDKLPRVCAWLSEHKKVFALSSMFILICAIIVRMFPIIPYWNGLRVEGFVACAIALCVVSVIRCTRYMSEVLAFLGKHSMNIYMTHTFFNAYWHPEWLHTCEYMRGGGILLFSC